MCQNTMIYVTDQRQKYLAEYLQGKKRPKQECNDFSLIKRIILPTPVSKLEQHSTENEQLKDLLLSTSDVTVFGGKFTKAWKEFLEEHQIPYVDLMEDEVVALENAKITAEAAIAVILQNSLYSIRGEKAIVTGYGRCGREIANALAALGGKVTVLARKGEHRKLAKQDGHNAMDFAYGPEEAYGTRIFVNTVPAMVVTEPMVREMHRDSLIVDIASSPGGCDRKAVERYGINYKLALGLPGIYTPKSSGKILAEAVERYSRKNHREGEESSWIFQIVL